MGKKGDGTRQYIKDHAKALFCQKGFKVVTMKDICQATGLSRGGLYRHYSSTGEIFLEIMGEFLESQNDAFSESIEKQVPAPEILTVILEKYQLEMLDAKGCLSMAIYEYFSSGELAESENSLSQRYQQSLDSWERLIQYGICRGEFRQVDIKAVCDLILFSYQGVRLYSQLMPIPKETPARIAAQIKQLLIKE